MIKKDFIKSSLIYTFSSALSVAASFLLLPFYTKSNLLSISDYGALALYIGLANLVQTIVSFSIDYYGAVIYHELKDKPVEQKATIASLNGYIIVLGLIVIAIAFFAGDTLVKTYFDGYSPSTFRYIMMSVITGVFNAHFKFYTNLLVYREKPLQFFWSNMLNFVTTIAFSIGILVIYPQTLEGPMWGRLLSCFCIFVVSVADITYNFGIAFRSRYLAATWRFCFPVMVTAVFQWILTSSDRYIIKPLLYNKEVAIFDLAVKCTLLVSFLLDGLSSAMSPRIFSLMRENTDGKNDAEIKKYYSAFNVVTLFLVALNILILPIFLPVFISDGRYLEAFVYFGIVTAGFATRGIQNLFLLPVYYYKQTSRLILINGVAAVFQVVIAYIMVRYFKLTGAAITLSIVKVILLILYVYKCRDLLTENTNFNKVVWLPMFIICFVTVMELFISKYGMKMHAIHLVEFIITSAAIYFIYRNEVDELFNWLLKEVRARTGKPA